MYWIKSRRKIAASIGGYKVLGLLPKSAPKSIDRVPVAGKKGNGAIFTVKAIQIPILEKQTPI